MTDSPRVVKHAPYFLVPDVDAASGYYTERFGFTELYRGGAAPEFAITERDGCAVMLKRADKPDLICPAEKQGGTWDVFFWTDRAEALFDELRGRGAIIVYEPTTMDYGMLEFAVRDLNGYTLGFGQQLGG